MSGSFSRSAIVRATFRILPYERAEKPSASTAFFSRLAERLLDLGVELGKFIEKKNAVMRERDFARLRIHAAADQARIAGRVMRIAERSARFKWLLRAEFSGDGPDLRRLQRLGK